MLYKRSKRRSKWKIRVSSFAPRNHCLIQLFVLFFFFFSLQPITQNCDFLHFIHLPFVPQRKPLPDLLNKILYPLGRILQKSREDSASLCVLSSNTPMKTVRLPCSLPPFLEDAVVKLAAPFTYTLYEFMPAYIKKLFWYKYLQGVSITMSLQITGD